MAEITGEFPKCTDTRGTENHKKNKSKKYKRKLQKAEYKLKVQKELTKERVKRCKAETELKYSKILLQHLLENCPPALPKSLVDPLQEIHDERDRRNP